MPFHTPLSAFNARPQTVLCFCALFISLGTPAFGQQLQVLLGDTNVERSVDRNPSGTAKAFPVRATATGQVNSVSVYLDSSNRAPTVWVGMYADQSGHPQALLAKGMISNPTAGQWNSVALPPVQVTQGTTYWLALLGVNGVVGFRDRYGRCRSEVGRQGNLTSLPAIWATGFSWPTCAVSMFETGSVTGTTPTTGADISVSPHAITLRAGQQQQFSAVVSGQNNTWVTWTASGGAIDRAGLYTAPSSPGTYTVTANAASFRRNRRAAAAATSDSAVVTVTQPSSTPPPTPTPPPTVTGVSISPTASSLQTGAQQQFSATVAGAANTGVIWSASGGTITSTGLYTAPGAAGTFTITAASSVDSTKSASALVVVAVPQQVTVTVSPTNASVGQAGSVQFTATVSGLSNKAVTWAVSRGNGTITQSGLYTAPRAAENDVITATSQADNTKSGTASINVVLPHSVLLNWDPSPSATVAFYKVYRGTARGGPYSVLGSNLRTTTYTDTSVQSGVTYYYVTTAVDAAGMESFFSNELMSVIPSP